MNTHAPDIGMAERGGPANAPTVSVVMPAYDAAAYVGAAIESILNQTLEDLELIVVDDDSRDDTGRFVRRYAASDRRVVLLQASVRSAAEARNVGMRHARGDFVALLDADDVAYPDRLRRQLEAAQATPESVLWGCYMRRITSEGLPMAPLRVGCRTVEEFRELDRTRSLVRCYGTSAFFRRELALRLGGFDRRFEPMEDSELWDRMVAYGPALVVPEVLQDYRQHEQSLSVTKIMLQRKWYEYLTRRHAARLRGRPFTLEDFERSHRRFRVLRDVDGFMRGMSQRLGRRYHIALARKQYASAARYGLLMVLAHPFRFARRLFPGAGHV